MKTLGDWITLGWVILLVIGCGITAWWMTTTLSTMTVYYITVVLNVIVWSYLHIVYGKHGKHGK